MSTEPFQLTPAADLDLEEAAFTIGLEQPQAAEDFIGAVYEAFHNLAAMPGMGSVYPLAHPRLQGIRKWPLRGFEYLIFYRERTTEVRAAPGARAIEIVRVLHGARDIPAVLQQENP